MKRILLFMALMLIAACDSPKPEPKIPDSFFEPVVEAPAPVVDSPAVEAPDAPAEVVPDAPMAPAEPAAAKFTNESGQPALNAYAVEVPGTRTDSTFTIDIVIEGMASFPDGFNSFAIYDVYMPEGVSIDSFEYGSMIGPRAYPFITNERIDGGVSSTGEAYAARFGGYGSIEFALKEDGTLYRLTFNYSGSGEVEFDRFYFSYFGLHLPFVNAPVKFAF